MVGVLDGVAAVEASGEDVDVVGEADVVCGATEDVTAGADRIKPGHSLARITTSDALKVSQAKA